MPPPRPTTLATTPQPRRPRQPGAALRAGVAAAVLAGVATLLVGCYVPPSVDHAVLQVTAEGRFLLEGQPVADALLADQLKAKTQAGVKVVQIEASPQAAMARVRQAVAAVEAAKAHVAFADSATGAGAAGVMPSIKPAAAASGER